MSYYFSGEKNTNISEEIRKGDYNFFSGKSFFVADTFRLIKIINIFISFILNLLYILSYIKTKRKKRNNKKNSFSFILIINILIANFLHTFSFLFNWMLNVKDNYYELLVDNNNYHIGGLLIGNPLNSMTICSLQGFLMVYSSLSQDFLINVLFYFMNNSEIPSKFKLRLLLLICGYLIPLLFSFIYLVTDNIGINERYCFIKKFGFDKGYHFNKLNYISLSIVLYVFRGANLIISSLFLYKIIKYIRKEKLKNIYIVKILIILITQVISISIEIIFFILDLTIKSNDDLITSDIFLCVNTLDGIFFPLIFSLSNSTYSNLFFSKTRNETMTSVTEYDNNRFESLDSPQGKVEIDDDEKIRFTLVQFIDTNNFDISF